MQGSIFAIFIGWKSVTKCTVKYKHRWNTKIRRTFAEVGDSDVPVERVDLVEASGQGLADVDSVESVCPETSCSQIFESLASDSLWRTITFKVVLFPPQRVTAQSALGFGTITRMSCSK